MVIRSETDHARSLVEKIAAYDTPVDLGDDAVEVRMR